MPLYVVPVCLLAIWFSAEGKRARNGGSLLATGLGPRSSRAPRGLRHFVTALVAEGVLTRNDPVLVAFNPYLTEDLLPIYTGLTDSGLSSLWNAASPDHTWHVIARLVCYHASALLILSIAGVGVAREWVRKRPAVPIAMTTFAALILYVLRREYGYGLYKLVSWTHVMFSLSFLLGLRALWGRGSDRVIGLRRFLAASALLLYLALNAGTAYYYAQLSTGSATGRFVTQQDFAGNLDWHTLEAWGQRRSGWPEILISLHQHVAVSAACVLRRQPLA